MRKNRGLNRDSRINFGFKFKPFDFMFQWVLGLCGNNGSSVGELFYIRSKIIDGDGESWFKEFNLMGDRVLKRADKSIERGAFISAGQNFLRCYSYYRAAPLFLNPNSDSRYRDSYMKASEYFKKGIKLLNNRVEHFVVDNLPGYIFYPEDKNANGKTLFMLGGGDTFVEDLYFYIAPQALERGYHLIIADLPGQGGLPWKGDTFKFNCEVYGSKVLDHINNYPDFPLESIGLFGISAGGYITPRIASYDERIKALVTCSFIEDLNTLWNTKLRTGKDSALVKLYSKLKPHKFKSISNLYSTYLWRWGAYSAKELIEKCALFKNDINKITCPVLNIISQGEYDNFKPTHDAHIKCKEKISDYQMEITPFEEGADSHAVGTNISLVSTLAFDFLDEKL